MNAPASSAALAAPIDQVIALASISPSATNIQELRRARFDKKLLAELAESIKVVGILQPIVARPAGKDRYEIVAGERRWLAAKLAGLKEIRASVADLTDEQVLEVQLIENLQREGLHELEEAEGYEELMKLKKISADTVADMVGRSRSYVFKRTKLLALCPVARKAFYAGELDASTALLVARIPHHDLQAQALKDLAEQREYGDVQNFKDAQRFFHDNFMLQLKAAPFKLDDANLVPKAGPCTTCPKRTGNQKDLFGDVKSGDVCTDPKCFAEKRKAGEAKLLAEYKAKGVEVIVGEAAKRVLPYADTNASGGYHVASSQCWEDAKRRKYSELVDEEDIKLVQSPHTGQLVKVVHNSALPKNKKTRKVASRAAGGTTGDFEIREKVAARVAVELVKKHPGTLGHDELLYFAQQEHESWDATDDSLYEAFKLPKNGHASLAKLSDKDLVRFVVAGAVTEGLINGYGNVGKFAAAVCKRFKLDPKKVRKEIEAAAAEAKKKAKAK